MAKILLGLVLLQIAALLYFAVPVGAHPGNTDANGGHTCRTNCAKWGYGTGEYHFHGGGSPTPILPRPSTTRPRTNTTIRSDPNSEQTDYTPYWVIGAGGLGLILWRLGKN